MHSWTPWRLRKRDLRTTGSALHLRGDVVRSPTCTGRVKARAASSVDVVCTGLTRPSRLPRFALMLSVYSLQERAAQDTQLCFVVVCSGPRGLRLLPFWLRSPLGFLGARIVGNVPSSVRCSPVRLAARGSPGATCAAGASHWALGSGCTAVRVSRSDACIFLFCR